METHLTVISKALFTDHNAKLLTESFFIKKVTSLIVAECKLLQRIFNERIFISDNSKRKPHFNKKKKSQQ